MEKIYSANDMYDFAVWYKRKIMHDQFAKYYHPINGKKNFETIKDLIDVWKEEAKVK